MVQRGTMTPPRRIGRGLILSLAGLAIASVADAADSDALWKIVSEKCVPKAAAAASPAPCRLVDLSRRYAALKDLVGVAQYLVIPTDRITGIESPVLEEPGSPNYWEAAWEARQFMAESLAKPVPRDDVGLAINSQRGRTQNQLHIHVDCVDPNVIGALRANKNAITAGWAAFPVQLAGHAYVAMRIEAPDLANVNPFRLLADGIPAARADMGDETIVAIATTFGDGQDGFVLLADRADLASGDRGSGEELLDHGCTILKQ
jgi:CDP-diacylglycerol pyrophosphatase